LTYQVGEYVKMIYSVLISDLINSLNGHPPPFIHYKTLRTSNLKCHVCHMNTTSTTSRRRYTTRCRVDVRFLLRAVSASFSITHHRKRSIRMTSQ